MDPISQSHGKVVLGARKPNLRICISPSSLPNVDPDAAEKTPVNDALSEVDTSHALPDSVLDVPLATKEILPSQVKQLFSDGLSGGRITTRRAIGGKSEISYIIVVDFKEDKSEESTDRLLPPTILRSEKGEFQEFETHDRFEPMTRAPSEHSKRCLECILKVKDRAAMQDTLRELFKRDPFRRASGRFHCMLQYHFCATCFAVLLDGMTMRRYSAEFKDAADLRAFLVGADVLPFLRHMAVIQAPTYMGADDEVPWQWYSVRGYALILMQAFVNPARGKLAKRTCPKRELDSGRVAARMLHNDGVVHWLMAMLGASAGGVGGHGMGLLEISHAVTLIKLLCATMGGVLESVLQANGIHTLSRLFASGALDRMVEELELDCIPRQDKFFLSLPVGHLKLVKSGTQSTEARLARARLHVALIRQSCGDLVMQLIGLSDLTRQHALALPGPISCIRSAVMWLKKPYTPEYGFGRGVVKSASQLLLSLVRGSHDVAHDLLSNMDLKPLLLRWLLAPHRWPVDDLLACIREILTKKTADCPCFRDIESFTPILDACGLYLYCSNRDIQENAHFIVTELCRASPRCARHLMSLDLLSPKLYSGKILPLLDRAKSGNGSNSSTTVSTVKKAFPIAPSDTEAWERKDDQLERILKTVGATRVMSRQHMKDQGEKAGLDDNLADAIAWYSAALLSPGQYDEPITAILYKRSELYYEQKRYDRAVQDATRVIAFDFDDKYSHEAVRALHIRALAFQSLGRIFEAYNDMLRCVHEMPGEDDHQKLLLEVQLAWKRMCERENEKVAKSTKAQAPPSPRCTKCRAHKSAMPSCARCKAPYCSVRCQRGHWSAHKSGCKSAARTERNAGL